MLAGQPKLVLLISPYSESMIRVKLRCWGARYRSTRNWLMFGADGSTAGSTPGPDPGSGKGISRMDDDPSGSGLTPWSVPHPRHNAHRYCCYVSMARSCYGSTRARSSDCCSRNRRARCPDPIHVLQDTAFRTQGSSLTQAQPKPRTAITRKNTWPSGTRQDRNQTARGHVA